MKKFSVVILVALVFSMLATDADARRAKKKRKHWPRQTTEVVVAPQPGRVSAPDNTTLCDGGMMVPADDQIKGCSALIASGRLDRERKAVAYYNRGNGYVAKSDFARAVTDYTDALSYKKDYAQAFFNRAVAYRVSGNFQLALTDYSSAIVLNPSDADAFAGRGIAYARLAQHEKAFSDFEQAIKLKPDHLVALTQRGHHYVVNQNWTAAMADYGAVLSLQKTNAEALYGRGVAKVYSGDVRNGQIEMAQAQAFDSGVAARMTSQGIPPPQISEQAPPITRRPVASAPAKADEKASPDAPKDAAQSTAPEKKPGEPDFFDKLFADPAKR